MIRDETLRVEKTDLDFSFFKNEKPLILVYLYSLVLLKKMLFIMELLKFSLIYKKK